MPINVKIHIEVIYFARNRKKGNDILVLDIRKLSSISDYFVIVSADSERGVKSLAENLVKDLKKKLKIKVRIDGLNDGRWVLIDSGDVIIHIFQLYICPFLCVVYCYFYLGIYVSR